MLATLDMQWRNFSKSWNWGQSSTEKEGAVFWRFPNCLLTQRGTSLCWSSPVGSHVTLPAFAAELRRLLHGAHSCRSTSLAQMGSRPITFLWLWPATDREPHCRRVPINKIWTRTESTPRSGWWRSRMAGIYSDCSTREINNLPTAANSQAAVARSTGQTDGRTNWQTLDRYMEPAPDTMRTA